MRALVAMSGGVDSSVAAALMREAGHDVVGVTLKLWSGPNGEAPTAGCCTVSDSEDARRVAAQVDIPYYVLDYTDEFRDGVVHRFVRDYGSGRTPNPCIECNRTVKFDRLLNGLADFDSEVLVTGHHARNRHVDGSWQLHRGMDRAKDQSYVLSMLTQSELSRIRLPVGELTKTEVRSIAAGMGLRTADKPESMDLCFVAAGETYQVNHTIRLAAAIEGDPRGLYRDLCYAQRGAYAAYVDTGRYRILSASPELFFRIDADRIRTIPMKGTAPRGRWPAEDAALRDRLQRSEKDRAENAMIVDLPRNDIGRVAQNGTVKLTEKMIIERYSHVQHIVSEVRGRLRPELDALDALRGCFPAGTVTGAPKVRAMEIIDELEPTRRGPYAGAVGYIGWGAEALDTAIALRTAILRGDRAYVQAGAGIVADSEPGREFEETESKAGAVLRALAIAARR